ncbi:thiamine diphosphokinase [Puniceibacterium sp. IMCC21224]|uniref:thiamine diphosphokinase n=1 Tax=Puniceibacterium sp. IMCC21224 TaxID=1618204 RepID=UPI00064DC18E|nr:thiamine diphosphokinase [Puniceibacterium sp. IMCC21224]KMK66820.1 thiamine pyrophosphokinase [Puniceibacterium sp. IMCC21224]
MIVHKNTPILLVGGAPGDVTQLAALCDMVNTVVAADGGLEPLLRLGTTPVAVIGDMDSVSEQALDALPPGGVHRIDGQDDTDFEKCLRRIEAPLVLGWGFLGGRVDHELAALTVLARYPSRRCVLVGASDLVLLCPPELDLDLPEGSRLSLWPLAPVTGTSQGLRWPIGGLRFAPDQVGGTSNQVIGPVHLRIAAAKMLLILPVSALETVLAALRGQTASWTAL